MKRIIVILGVFMLFSLMGFSQVTTAGVDSTKALVLNGPQKKKVRTGTGVDELSPLEAARASRAREINGDRFFLEYQANDGAHTARKSQYNQLTVRESNRRRRYLEMKRADMAQTKLQDFVGEMVSSTGYKGLVMNTNPYRTYTFSICPLNGGDNTQVVLGPNQRVEVNLLPGIYVVTVSDSWSTYRDQFRVPKQVYIDGTKVSWAVYNPQNM